MPTAYRINWIESERGWGTRDDGYSLHVSEAEAKRYVDEYWDGMPDDPPDEYSRPDSEPFLVEIDNETAKKLKKKKSLRF